MISAEEARKWAQEGIQDAHDRAVKDVAGYWTHVERQIKRCAEAGRYSLQLNAPNDAILKVAKDAWQEGASQLREQGFEVVIDPWQVTISWEPAQ